MTATPEDACPTPSLSSADMTPSSSNDPASAPQDALPVLKIGLDPGRPHVLTDVTGDVGKIDFDAGVGARSLTFGNDSNPRERRWGVLPSAAFALAAAPVIVVAAYLLARRRPDDSSVLRHGRLRLDDVRSPQLRIALRHAALGGEEMPIEFYPDGEQPGAPKVVAQCWVTRTSVRASGARSSSSRPQSDGRHGVEARRDDRFRLSLKRGATYEHVAP